MNKQTKTTTNCSSGSGSSGCGCVSFVLGCIILWALVFGVTWEGKHYGLSCTCDRGVVIDWENLK
jgi:hypothetical protein